MDLSATRKGSRDMYLKHSAPVDATHTLAQRSRLSTQLPVAIGTYLLILALVLSSLIVYRISGEATQSLWSGRFRWPMVALLLGMLAGAGILALAYKRSAHDRVAFRLLLA